MRRFRAAALFLVAGLAAGPALAELDPDDPSDPAAGVPRVPSPADSLPAFRNDSLRNEPFRQAEAGVGPGAKPAPQTQAARDSVKGRLRGRRPAVSAYFGVGFLDLDGKEKLNTALSARVARDSLRVLQPYEPVHLAFPGGLQAVFPVGNHFDLVAKTHSYWYSQEAILGDSLFRRVGDETYSLYAHLGGVGLRYYVPPDLLSVAGAVALYIQALGYWQLGSAEIYTNHGGAEARFDPFGSGYELTLGFYKELAKAWSLSGTLGVMRQDFASRSQWGDILPPGAAPPGPVEWGASSLQASLNLWYHFGFRPPAPAAQGADGQGTLVPGTPMPSDPASPPPPR